MVNRLVSVGDDFTLPAAVKAADANLPTRLGAAALDATYTLKGEASETADQGDRLVSKLRIKTGTAVAGIAGDSTGNATNEWPTLLLNSIAAEEAGLAVTEEIWNPTGGVYDPTITIQTSGGAETHADTFTRTGALEGSTADDGQAWSSGVPSADGNWTTDGTKAVRSSSAGTGEVVLNVGSSASIDVTMGWAMIHGGTPATTKDRRVLLAYKDASNYLYVRVATATNNALVWSLNKRVAGAASTLVTGSAAALTSSSSPQTPTLNMSYVYATGVFTATLGAETITSTLDAAGISALSGAPMLGLYASPTAEAESIDNLSWTVPGVSGRSLHMYNGSISGSRLEVHLPLLADMFPAPLDVLFISSSHNYTTRTLAEYETALDEFLAAFKAHDPNAGIVIMSQNPQNYDSVNPTRQGKQFERCAFLKSYARKNGIGYIPVTEAFMASGDWSGLVSNTTGDFIHPTGGEEVGGVKTGSSLWRDTVKTYLDTL